MNHPTQSILHLVRTFTRVADDPKAYPMITPVAMRVLRMLAEDAISLAPMGYTIDRIESEIGCARAACNEAVQFIPGLIAYYAPEEGLQIEREQVRSTEGRSRNIYLYHLRLR